jgi:trans-aconitate methyltransferase
MSQWNAHLYDTALKFVSDYGKDVVELLKPTKGETILDLGCGTGDLTAEIAASGAKTIGLDNSKTMLERASKKHPEIAFIYGEATDFTLEEPVNAVFSNATLHWVIDQEKALANVYKTLKPNGRLVVELGGKGNVHCIIDSIQKAISQAGYPTVELSDIFYFPSVGEYASLLEKVGFRVECCFLFERPTLIMNGAQGFKDWIDVLGIRLFQNVPINRRPEVIDQAVALMMIWLEKDERYFADYVRLRVAARKIV